MKRIVINEASGNDMERVSLLLKTVGIDFSEEEPDEVLVCPTMTDGAQEQAIEPENIDKVKVSDPFVKAQISTKNQMILRNILAALSSLGVVIVFILEKLGIM